MTGSTFVEPFNPDAPIVARDPFAPDMADRRDGYIEAYDEAIGWLRAGDRASAREVLERAAALEDEAGMVIRARTLVSAL